MNTLVLKSIAAEKIILNSQETASRLKTEKGYTNSQIENCLETLKKSLNCKYIYTKTAINRNNSLLDLGFGEFESSNLAKNLEGCSEAFIFAVTLGFETDRLLNRLSLISGADNFICDALASSAAEAVCDIAENEIKGSLACKPRYSPGYGDLSLEVQPRILEMLNAQRLCGITINSALLMSPSKTITCIMGIKE